MAHGEHADDEGGEWGESRQEVAGAHCGQLYNCRVSHDYLLANAATERERLRLQSLVWEDAAAAMFEQIPVQRGWKCVDVGCGAVGVLRPLSRLVGPEGSVTGVDVAPELLASAAEFVEENGLQNVVLQQANVFAGDLPPASFDLVHLRFMFAPLGRHEELLRGALALCRPGGVVAIEEPDARCWSLMPPHAAFDELRDLILRAFAASGGDFNVGTRTFAMLRAAGLEHVNVRASVHALPPRHPYLRVIVQFAASLRNRILEGALATAEQLDRLVREVEEVLASDDAAGTTFLVTQVWGTKPLTAA